MERFFVLDFIQRCYTDNGSGSGHMIPGQLRTISSSNSDILGETGNPVLDYGLYLGLSLITVDRDKMRQVFENYYDNYQQWAHKTPWQLHQENIDFDIDRIREIFLNPPAITDYSLNWTSPDVDKVVEFLSGERGFSETRVRSALEKTLKNIDEQKKQPTLDSFFGG